MKNTTIFDEKSHFQILSIFLLNWKQEGKLTSDLGWQVCSQYYFPSCYYFLMYFCSWESFYSSVLATAEPRRRNLAVHRKGSFSLEDVSCRLTAEIYKRWFQNSETKWLLSPLCYFKLEQGKLRIKIEKEKFSSIDLLSGVESMSINRQVYFSLSCSIRENIH